MSGFTSFASAAGAAANPGYTYEYAGFNSAAAGSTVGDGQGRPLVSNASANQKGAGVQLLSSTASAWTGLILFVVAPDSGSSRYLIDLSFSGDVWTSPEVANLYFQSNAGNSGMGQRYELPVRVPQGSNIYARVQCSAANAGGTTSLSVAVVGVVGGADDPPGYANCENILADAGNTRSSTVSVTANDANWTSLKDPLARAYGAVMSSLTNNATTANQRVAVQLADGPSGGGSEAEFARYMGAVQTGGPTSGRNNSPLIAFPLASGRRVSAKIASASGSDTQYVGLIGFY